MVNAVQKLDSLFHVGASHHLVDEVFVLDVALEVDLDVCELHDQIHLVVGQPLAHGGEEVAALGGGDVSLALTVEGLEALLEVAEGAPLLHVLGLLEDGQDLLEGVVLLAHLVGASDAVDELLGGVEADAAQHVAHLGGVHLAVTAVPEVEQVEHILHLFDFLAVGHCAGGWRWWRRWWW